MPIFGLLFLVLLCVRNSESSPDTHVHVYIPPEKGSAPHTGGDQIYETGADYSEDTTNSKTISGSTEAPRSTKAVEPIIHEGEQGSGGELVNCGGHTATSCGECPEGNGYLWCNGECEWRAISSTSATLGCITKTGTSVNCGAHKADSCVDCPLGYGKYFCNGDCQWNNKCQPKEGSVPDCKWSFEEDPNDSIPKSEIEFNTSPKVEVTKQEAQGGARLGYCEDASVYQGIDIPYPTCPGEGDFVYTVWVGVVFPKQHSGRVFLSLCQAQKCVTIRQNRYPSVWIGKEGKGTPTCKIASDEVINDKKFQIKQVQVTDVMVKQRWSWKKPLTAKITEKNETSVLNLPEPLIILYKIKRSSVIDDPLIVIRNPNRSSSVIESKVISPKENMQRYGNLLYRNLAGTCRDVCTTVNNKRDCEAMCYPAAKPEKYFVKVYVGVVMPRLAPGGIHTFNLCQDGKCVKGGRASTWGAFNDVWPKLQPGEVVDDEKFLIYEAGVSDVLRDEGWSFLKPLEAKMTTNLIKNLPEPVVVIKTFEVKRPGGRKVVEVKLKFNSKEKRERYGNLLDKYSI